MALRKLEPASLTTPPPPPPPPTLLERLRRLDANINQHAPALQNIFVFVLGASLATVVMVGAVTLVLFSIGAALFALYQGAKTAVDNS